MVCDSYEKGKFKLVPYSANVVVIPEDAEPKDKWAAVETDAEGYSVYVAPRTESELYSPIFKVPTAIHDDVPNCRIKFVATKPSKGMASAFGTIVTSIKFPVIENYKKLTVSDALLLEGERPAKKQKT